MERWTTYYDCCIVCGTTERKHRGKGYCSTCWHKQPKVIEQEKLYRGRTKEKIKQYKKDWNNKNPNYWKDYHKKNSLKKRIMAHEWQLKHEYGGHKEDVLTRDGFKCVRCGCTAEDHYRIFGMTLHIHHKDRNRSNNTLDNLETICIRCHGAEHASEALKSKMAKIENGTFVARKHQVQCIFKDCSNLTASKYKLCKKHYKTQSNRLRKGLIKDMGEHLYFPL